MNNTSIDKILKQIISFKRDVKGALELLDFETNLDENKVKLLSGNIDVDKKKKDFQEVIDLLNIFEMILTTNYIFIDFDLLAVFLVYFNSRFKLNDNDKKNIVFNLLEKNINSGILDDSVFIINKDYLLKYRDKDKIKINDLKGLSGFNESSNQLTKELQNYHRVIFESYLNKRQKSGELDNFTLEDLTKIQYALLGLRINNSIIKSIVRSLKTKIKKENNYKVENKVIECATKSLSKKEYYEINIELRKFFYFDTNSVNVSDLNNSIMIYQSLSEREKIRCVFLLKKGGYDVSTIDTFLRKVETININSNNFLDSYNNDFKYMLEYYIDEYGYDYLSEEVNDIIAIINSLTEGSLEYLQWITELRNLINNVIDNISFEKKKTYVLKRIKDYEKTERWI